MPKQKSVVSQHPQDSISETELCVCFGKCPRTLMYWRKAGRMPQHFLCGKQVRYLLSEIAAFEQEQAKGEQA